MYHNILAIALAAIHVVNAIPTKMANGSWWHPAAAATWNINLPTNPTVFSPASVVGIYDLDLFGTTNTTIASLHASGHRVICYFSAGSYEDWRPDASQFPAKALGKALDGWPGEKWLNTSDPTVRSIMAARIKTAAGKGCDGVDPDNIDGYGNDSGLKLTTTTAADYVRFLAGQAHALGMASGLKNGGDIAAQVVGNVDFEVNESCVQYSECDTLTPFVKAGKPVFHIEYTEVAKPTSSFVTKSCGRGTTGFSTLMKHMDLGVWTATCPKGNVTAF